MSHLSQALEKYYSRQGKRILFSNKQSLSWLAMAMWEELGFQQVDASVLSRVLKGERSFTAPQLEAFCAILHVPEKEKEYLFACLEQDRSARFSLHTGSTHISSVLTEEVIGELTRDAFDMFYRGDYETLEKRYELIIQLAGAYKLGDKRSKAAAEALGVNIYLHGRMIANGELPSRVIGKVYPIFRQLLEESKKASSTLLYGYAYVLMSTAYYIAGGYSDASRKHRFYTASIKLAHEAVNNLSAENHESLFALRSMAASAAYTHDQATITYVLQRMVEVVPKQPESNYINALHLGATVAKSLATMKASDPFVVHEFTADYFKKTLANTGVYEISGIKEEIDTLLLLETGDKNYIRGRLEEGLRLANVYDFSRQKKYFNKLLATV